MNEGVEAEPLFDKEFSSTPRLPTLSRRVALCLRALAGPASERPARDRGEAERWLALQGRHSDIATPIAWADGPGEAVRILFDSAAVDMMRMVASLARNAAQATARRILLADEEPDRFFAAAANDAERIIATDLDPLLTNEIEDPRSASKFDAAWNVAHRFAHKQGARSAILADCWMGNGRTALVESAVDALLRQCCTLPEPNGWTAAWVSAWIGGWSERVAPARARDETLDEAGADHLEAAAGRAAAAALDAARLTLRSVILRQRRLVLYGAFCALGEINAGPPVDREMLAPWRAYLRSFMRPFYAQAMAGLHSVWLGSSALLCLPRPVIRRLNETTTVTWPNGEQFVSPRRGRT